jgi:hypothetical protein
MVEKSERISTQNFPICLSRWLSELPTHQAHSRRYVPNVRLLRSAGCSLSVTADVRAKGSSADVPDNRPLSGAFAGRVRL